MISIIYIPIIITPEHFSNSEHLRLSSQVSFRFAFAMTHPGGKPGELRENAELVETGCNLQNMAFWASH
jgi:hypothetical protein